MKNKRKNVLMVLLNLVLIGVLTIYSCKKENEEKNDLTTVRIGKNYEVKDGVLVFKTADEFKKLTDSLILLRPQELQNWEKGIGFKSFKSIQDSLLDLLPEACSETEFLSIVYENPQYLKFENNDVDLVEIGSSYELIANKDAVFCINNIYHKVSSNKVITTQANCIKEAKNNFEQNKLVNLYERSIIKNHLKTTTDCDAKLISSENHVGSTYRDGYRYVRVDLIIAIDPNKESNCCVYYTQTADLKIVGKMKNIWGQTYTQSTTHSFKGLSVTFDKLLKNGSVQCTNIYGCTSTTCDNIKYEETTLTFTDYTSPEQKVYTKRLYTGPTIYNYPVNTNTKFNKSKVKAWTRGTGEDNAAIICCNYESCGF